MSVKKAAKDSQPMDALRVRFIEALDAIMRDNPKVRSVKNIARIIRTPYLGLHKVYNFHKHKTAYPTTWHLLSTLAAFPTLNPDRMMTGRGEIYRDIETENLLEDLVKRVSQLEKVVNIKTRR
jgi:hypothetical protein